MINYTEQTAVELSPTKKDFYQIWNEILETAGKISERWDPSSTNESDPGIVLLKVLTAVADKLNYQIDANTLEAFMPSAAQEDSMRKLCDMMGYNMKYYQSATTDVKITYNNSSTSPISGILVIDKFTNIKDIDGNINYVTLEPVYMNSSNTSKIVTCMEGELVECETDDDNIISMLQLDDHKRYYLPETQIAENGIFITNINDNEESDPWEKVTNLNTQNINSKIFKFGFDSREQLPYIQFPDDISSIIEDGLKIKYLRTNGANGNISVNTLSKMETPASWSTSTDTSSASSETQDYYNVDNYIITNTSATHDGKDCESINDAYDNYKKTIGTFDTLVTCRDYINAIYNMTTSDTSATNLVSNVIVSDIRDDINRAFTLCTFTEQGVEYKSMAKPIDISNGEEITQEDFKEQYEKNPTAVDLGKLFKVYETKVGTVFTNLLYYSRCIFNGNSYEYIKINTKALTHFDLLIYPFRNIYGLNTQLEFVKSFTYDESNLAEITDNLETSKTLAHNIISPTKEEIACIKNYFQLDAKITTTRKVNAIEQADILGKVYSKLYENFNMRRMDFGEELPYDSILTVLESADSRIKNVSLQDPTIITKFCTVGGGEFRTSTGVIDDDIDPALYATGDKYFNNLVLNNVLAGRVALLNYDENFKPEYTETQYPSWVDGQTTKSYDLVYPNSASTTGHDAPIYNLSTAFDIYSGAKDLVLNDNEVVQFRLPNLKTTKTFPAYVNYFITLDETKRKNTPAIAATMQSMLEFLNSRQTQEVTPEDQKEEGKIKSKADSWNALINENGIKSVVTKFAAGVIKDATTFNSKKELYGAILSKNSEGKYCYESSWQTSWHTEVPQATALSLTDRNLKLVDDTSHAPVQIAYTVTPTTAKEKLIWTSSNEAMATVDDDGMITPLAEGEVTITATGAISQVSATCKATISKTIEEETIAPISRETWDIVPDLYYASIDDVTKFATWVEWISTRTNNVYDQEEKTEGKAGTHTDMKRTGGIFVANGTDSLYSYGELVDNTHTKYKSITSAATFSDKILTHYFVQRLWVTDAFDKSGNVFTAPDYHTDDGLGQNSKSTGIVADEEYRLQDSEQLLINYTSSSTTDGNETKTKINLRYGPGTIIKPNFELIDSLAYRKLHSYSKTEGFTFIDYGIQNPAGMFTLGTDEQIELREFVEVTLDEVSTNIYWQLNNEIPDSNNRIYFNFDAEPETYTDPYGQLATKNTAYTLKDGEYFYYTDANKTDIAYYGAGTKIKRTVHTPEIFKYNKDGIVSADDISSSGLSAAIPWKPHNFSKSGGFDKALTIVEYQYINLIKDSELNTVKAIDSNLNDESTSIEIDIDNEFTPIKGATYTINGVMTELPVVELTSSESPNTSLCWEVRSKLELNVGPTIVQTLHNVAGEAADSLKLYAKNGDVIDTITPHNNVAVSLKTNKLIQTSSDKISVTTKTFADDGHLEKEVADLQIKVLNLAEIRSDGDNAVGLNNFGDEGHSKIDFTDTISKGCSASTTLNAVIPSNRFGLIMMYNNKLSVAGKSIAIRFIKANPTATPPAAPVIYNHNDTWWNEVAGEINPEGCGKTTTKIVWAVEGNIFAKLTESEFNALRDTGNIWYREAETSEPNAPESGKRQRYDGQTKTLYTYNEVKNVDEWQSDCYYGQLNNIQNPWSHEIAGSFRLYATKADFAAAFSQGTLFARTYETWSPTPENYYKSGNTSSWRYDYINKQLYKYTGVSSSAEYKDYKDKEGTLGSLLDEGGSTTLYHLRKAINTVMVKDSCKVEFYYDGDETEKTDTLIISSLDIIVQSSVIGGVAYSAINDKLSYKVLTSGATTEQQILADIKKLDPNYNFYYNNIISSTLGIDMNIKDDEDNLENATNWFDYNNINNKFVVSEIDAKYLPDHVIIAKSSRSNY